MKSAKRRSKITYQPNVFFPMFTHYIAVMRSTLLVMMKVLTLMDNIHDTVGLSGKFTIIVG